jgi:hypothetical protein
MSAEIGDIVRDLLPYLVITPHLRKVLTNIKNCRTIKLGRHKQVFCDNNDCDYSVELFNSCRDRNCPKCQGSKRLKWVLKQLKDVLPINYFHVVFTIPSSLRKLFKYNKKVCYNLLFKAASQVLNEVSAKNRKLKAKIGFIAILHTWTQRLHFHPHLHCIVTGGGISLDKTKWNSCHEHYFLPVKVLQIMFKGKLLQFLEQAYNDGLINYPETETDKNLLYLNNFHATLKKASRSNWVIYTKKSFVGPSAVINYLGNYTHRIALSNKRIISYKDKKVTFRWKDRRDGNKDKIETLDASDFIQRYMFHILPSRFVKIRYYGLLAGANRKKNIELSRTLIEQSGIKKKVIDKRIEQEIIKKIEELSAPKSCPCCKTGLLIENLDLLDQEVRAG